MDPFSVFSWEKTRKAIQDLQMLLQCSICKEQPKDPLCMGACDHFFCASCISKQQTNSCPVCSVPSPPIQHKPDAIVSGLISCASDILTLINGGQIARERQSFEAPPDVHNPYAFDVKNNSNDTLTRSSYQSSSKKKKEQASPKPKKQRLSNRGKPKKKISKEAEHPLAKLVKSPLQNDIPVDQANEEKVVNAPSTPKHVDSTASASKRMVITPPTPAINKRNSKGETVLHTACIKGHLEKIENLLSEGADPNTKDNAGWTPLHEACSSDFIKVAERLLEFGALVDAPGNNNITPLQDAIIHGFPDIVILLKRWGASDKLRDIWGRSARSLADLCTASDQFHTALDTLPETSLVAPKKKDVFVQSKLVLTGSNLDAKGKRDLDSVAKLLKARVISDFSPDITHVVVNCHPGMTSCQRTIKYMMGVVSGKFIVSTAWVDECLSLGGYINPEAFEVTGCTNHPSSEAPAKGKLNVSLLKPGLFSGLHVYFQGSFSDELPTKKDLDLLIKYGSGVALQREPNPESISDSEQTVPYYAPEDSPLLTCSHLCIYQEGTNEPLLKYDMPHIKTLPMAWLLECIDNCQLVDPFK